MDALFSGKPAGRSREPQILPGTAAYRRINLSLFFVGFSTFSLLYDVQSLLPLFAAIFHVSPTQSSMALSLGTGFLAVSILVSPLVSEFVDRRAMIVAALAATSLLNALFLLWPNWPSILVIRAVQGMLLGGVPAVAMAYLAEEIDPRGLGFAMGLYVGGTAFGGMVGRVGTSFLVEHLSWPAALATIGAINLLMTGVSGVLLPRSRHFAGSGRLELRMHLAAIVQHVSNARLMALFAIDFLAVGGFITVYNYIGFRLLAPEYGLSQIAVGAVFSVYLFGIVASSLAGSLVDRHGLTMVLIAGLVTEIAGILLTLHSGLYVVGAGIAVLTTGFFTVHASTSGGVGRIAVGMKGHATSLFLLSYYLGSSLLGSLGGRFYERGGWTSLGEFTVALSAAALVISVLLARRLSGPSALR